MPVNNGRSTPTQRGAKRIYENIFDRYTDKKYMYVCIYLYKYIYTYLFTYIRYMYISNITHVNITNYLEISFQSVSDSVLVQQQQHVTSRNQSQPAGSWSVGTSRSRLGTVGTNRRKETVGTRQNRAEPVSPRVFWRKVLFRFLTD